MYFIYAYLFVMIFELYKYIRQYDLLVQKQLNNLSKRATKQKCIEYKTFYL